MTPDSSTTTLNNHEAGRVKRHAVLTWLAHWHIATVQQMLLVGDTSSKKFIYTMRQRGLLRVVDQVRVNDTVMMLTNAGKSLAGELTPRARFYNTDISKVRYTTMRHQLATADLVLKNKGNYAYYTPEQFVEVSGKRGEKRPDVLLHHGPQATTAVEIELECKKDRDVFLGFLSYVRLLRDRRLSQVVYAFRTPAMRDHYQKIFESETWPLFERNPQGRWTNSFDPQGREQRLARDDLSLWLPTIKFQMADKRISIPSAQETDRRNLGPLPHRSRIRITDDDWRAVDPEADPGAIRYLTVEEVFNPPLPAVKQWYENEQGRKFGHVKMINGRWKRIMLTTESGHCEKLTLDEFKSLGLTEIENPILSPSKARN